MNLTRTTGIKRIISNLLHGIAMLPFIHASIAKPIATLSSRFFYTLKK